jgi:hypothetical protein
MESNPSRFIRQDYAQEQQLGRLSIKSQNSH